VSGFSPSLIRLSPSPLIHHLPFDPPSPSPPTPGQQPQRRRAPGHGGELPRRPRHTRPDGGQPTPVASSLARRASRRRRRATPGGALHGGCGELPRAAAASYPGRRREPGWPHHPRLDGGHPGRRRTPACTRRCSKPPPLGARSGGVDRSCTTAHRAWPSSGRSAGRAPRKATMEEVETETNGERGRCVRGGAHSRVGILVATLARSSDARFSLLHSLCSVAP
jgi:hypothetical protein